MVALTTCRLFVCDGLEVVEEAGFQLTCPGETVLPGFVLVKPFGANGFSCPFGFLVVMSLRRRSGFVVQEQIQGFPRSLMPTLASLRICVGTAVVNQANRPFPITVCFSNFNADFHLFLHVYPESPPRPYFGVLSG